jgi:FAD/FMN-containing dehydrogenase
VSWVSHHPLRFAGLLTDLSYSVGVSGHVLHGGYGFASRTHGLTLDWLIGATVILADGSKVDCSSTENKDLFWALRGAGSSFGIVAELEFNTFKAPTQVTPFAVELDWNESEAVAGIKALQDLAASAPAELNMQIYIAATGQTIQGVYFGDRNGLNAALKPLLNTIDTQFSSASTMGWIEGLEHYADGTALDQTYPYNLVRLTLSKGT